VKGLILTDVDGVLLNFMPSFDTWVRGLGIAPSNLNGRTIADYLNISDEIAARLVEAFFYQDSVENLDAYPAALEVLPRLYSAGWRFVAVTAIPNEPDIVARRRRNLEQTFGLPFDAVHCVGYRGDKSKILGAYRPTIWVEDHGRNAEVGAELGHRAFLIETRSNHHVVPVKAERITGWREIEQAIA
jgi:FMN phosphatase YigB (HAD superfamily)